MKTCTFKLLLLLLLMMVGGTEVYAEKVYKLVKVNSVQYGYYYVFEQDGRVMNNAVSDKYELKTTSSYNTTGLTGSESYVWKVVKFVNDNNWYLRNESINEYLYNSGSTDLAFGRNNKSAVSFTFNNGVANIKCNGRTLAYTSSSSYVYKAYSSTSSYNNITVYRLYAYPNLSFSSSSVTINSDEEDGLVPTFVNPEGVDGITFKSSYNEVASINSEGVITLGGSSGTAVITATYPGSAEYLADEAKCVITVNKLAQEDEPEAGGYYSRVTSIGDITNGQYLIVCESQNTAFNGGLETLDNNNNKIDVVISDNKISKTSATEAAEFTVTSVTGGYTIRSKSGKYIGHDGSDNGLLESESTSYKNSISIDNDVMSIRMYSGYSLRYNSSYKYKRFRYYDGQTPTRLYKYIAPAGLSTVDVVVSQAGLATYASNFDLDFSDVEGLSAYRAVESEGSVELHKVVVVPNGEGVLLRSTNGGTNFSVPVTDSATPWVDGYNDFKRGTGAAVASETDGKHNYILNVVDNKLGFYKAAGNTVATNRAYLQTSAALSRNSIVFDDEEENQTTTVTDIVNSSTCDGFLYNLNGQRVKSLSSGLYISGGKLVFKKK